MMMALIMVWVVVLKWNMQHDYFIFPEGVDGEKPAT